MTIQTAEFDGRGRRITKVTTNSGDSDKTVVYLWDGGVAHLINEAVHRGNVMSLEDRITGGFDSYISRIEYDETRMTIEIEFVADPEEDKVDRILRFSGVEEFRQEVDEDEDVDLELLIGLDEHGDAQAPLYVVHTDVREMVFRTTHPPTISRVGENKG